LKPLQWKGLPVNLCWGIEQGLIHELQPKWDKKKDRRALADAIRNKQKGSEISN